MSAASRGRSTGLLLVGAGAAVFLMVFAAVIAISSASVERLEITHLRATSQIAREYITEGLMEISEHLRQLAIERTSTFSGAEADWFRALDRTRARRPGLMRAMAVVNDAGSVTWSTPAGRDIGLSALASSPAVAAALASGNLSLGEPIELKDAAGLVVLALPLADAHSQGSKFNSALVVAVDVNQFVHPLLEAMANEAAGSAFLATARGAIVSSTGDRGLLAQPLLSRLVSGVGTSGETASRVRSESGVAALAVLEPFTASDSGWVLGVMRPQGAIVRVVRPFMIATGLLLLALAGLGTAGAVMLVRERRIAFTLRDEAARLARVAERDQRDHESHHLGDSGREPSVYVRDGRIVAANLAAVRALELHDLSELLGRPLSEFVASEERERLEKFLAGRIAGGSVPEQFQVRLVTPRGNRLVEMVTSLVERTQGVVEHVTWRDVTSRERAEALLRVVAQCSPSAFVLLDGEGKVAWANPAFAELAQRPIDRLQGRLVLPAVVLADRRRAQVLFARAVRGKPAEASIHVARSDGEVLLLRIRAMRVIVAGDPLGTVCSVVDITPQEHVVAGQGRSRRGEVLAAFATAVAHRLSNDFQALLGTLETLKREKRLEPLRATVGSLVAKAGDELHRFVVVARGGTSTLQPLHLGTTVKRWCDRAIPALPAEVRFSFRNDASEDEIVADGAQIALFLGLALTESVAGLEPTGGAIEVRLENTADRRAVRLTISDTSSVTEAEALGEGGTLHTSAPGGLAAGVAEIIALRHEGSAGEHRNPALGRQLWLELRLHAAAESRERAAAFSARSGAILVADDEELVRSTLAGALRERGWVAREAVNGAEAVDLVDQDPSSYALVVLDLVMPVMDGREALRLLCERHPEVPVLLCTGYDPSGDDVMAAAEVITKPFSMDEFVARVDSLVASGRGASGEGDTIIQ